MPSRPINSMLFFACGCGTVMEVLLLRSIISFIWAHARDECSQTVSSAFTDRNQCWMPTPNSFLEQLLQETNIITNRFVLDQQKEEKCFEHGHNCKEVEGKRGQNCWSDEQSAVSPCVKSTSHQSAFVPLTWKVWQLTIRRDKLWLQFFFFLFPSEPSLVLFFGRRQREKV